MLNAKYFVIWLIALLFLTGKELCAQMPDYHVRVFNEKDGIHPSGLRGMIRSADGYLWLLYSDRVLRFDGKRTKVFNTGDDLISIKCDKTDGIWVNSASNLYKFTTDEKGFEKVLVDTSGQPALITVLDFPDKSPTILTNRGFYRYNADRAKFMPVGEKFTVSGGVRTLQTSFAQYGDTFFYISSDTIVALSPQRKILRKMYAREAFGLTPINEHTLLVSDWKSQTFVYDFRANTIKELTIGGNTKTGDFFRISDALPLDSSRFLLAINLGLAEYNSRSGKTRLIKLFYNGMPYTTLKAINKLYKDNRQNVWVASNTGLLVFNPYKTDIGLIRNWEEDPQKAFSNHIRNFAADDKGNLWMATLNGFASLNLKSGAISPYLPVANATDRLNHPSIRGIVFDGRNLILGQTNRGIWLYNPLSKQYKRPPNTPVLDTNDFVDQIYTLRNGNHVIIARYDTYLMDGKTYRIKVIEYPGRGENPIFCYQDKQNRVWISTIEGFYCLNADLQYRFTVTKKRDNFLSSMCQTDDNVFYIGTKGLYKLTLDGQNAKFDKADPFFDDIRVVSLYKDHNDKLWMGSDKGIFSYDISTGHIESYGHFDNVQTGIFYHNSLYRVPDGPLFMGGTNGLNYFYPEKLKAPNDSLQVSLQTMLVNGKDAGYYPHFADLELKHSQNDLEITFSAPYFNNPGRVNYRYQMEGLDDVWKANGNNNSIRFSSLASGEYAFRVAASVNGLDWYEIKSPLHFNISPPFWETWWFIGLAVLLLLAGLYWWIHVLRLRIRTEEILNRFATSLFGQNTVDEAFWDVAKNCIELLGFEDCVIYHHDEDKGVLIQKAAAGPKGNPEVYKINNAINILMGEGIVGAVALSQKAEIIPDTRNDPRYILDDKRRLSEITVPIIVEGKTYGVIDSEHSRKGFFKKWHLHMLQKIAGVCEEKALKHLIEENIRTKIASDLHDEMGSTLTSINIISKIALDQTNGNKTMQDYWVKIKSHSGQMMESMSDIVWAINPANDSLEKIFLRMKEFAAELLEPLNIDYSFDQQGAVDEVRFNPSVRKDIFLIYKEALNNAVKYSKATEISIKLKEADKMLQIRINDNGIGFDAAARYSGAGIKNMHKRASQCGARLKLSSAAGKGTAVLLQIPITPLGYRNAVI